MATQTGHQRPTTPAAVTAGWSVKRNSNQLPVEQWPHSSHRERHTRKQTDRPRDRRLIISLSEPGSSRIRRWLPTREAAAGRPNLIHGGTKRRLPQETKSTHDDDYRRVYPPRSSLLSPPVQYLMCNVKPSNAIIYTGLCNVSSSKLHSHVHQQRLHSFVLSIEYVSLFHSTLHSYYTIKTPNK